MADLNIRDIEPSLLADLKIAAVVADKTLRGYVLDILRNAVHPFPKQRRAK